MLVVLSSVVAITGSMRPAIGVQPRRTPKTSWKINPNQKTGIE